MWDGDPSGDQDQGYDAQQVGKHEEDLIGDGRTDDLLQTHLISIKSRKEQSTEQSFPGKALFGALLFAAFDAYQMRLQQVIGSAIPYQVFLMLPYLLSIVALILISRRVAIPQALMIPYRKGER